MNVHDSRYGDLVVSGRLTVDPSIPITAYRDSFGNPCNRVLAPAGRLRLAPDGVINDSGLPDQVYVDAVRIPGDGDQRSEVMAISVPK